MFTLKFASPDAWITAVVNNLDAFLVDHAAAEKKASGMALSMVSHYPDRSEIVAAMTDLAVEELAHFREVVKLLYGRGLQLGADERDQYVNQLRALQRKGTEVYLLDRLLIASIVEARGCERFGLIAEALPTGSLKDFYRKITDSEARHKTLFTDLAGLYFAHDIIRARLDALLREEARIVKQLPIRPALH